MSDYLLREIRKALDRPTRQEIIERLRTQPVRRVRPKTEELITAERDFR